MADGKALDDRQLDAVLDRLDGLRDELRLLNQRLDHTEGYLALAHELRSLNESLQALAYAALGQQVNPRGVLVFPIAVYSHSEGCSITGGYVYRGRSILSAHGRYFYGDYCSGTIWSLRTSKGKLVGGVRREPFKVSSLSSFGEDAAGELYATSLDGTVYKLSS